VGPNRNSNLGATVSYSNRVSDTFVSASLELLRIPERRQGGRPWTAGINRGEVRVGDESNKEIVTSGNERESRQEKSGGGGKNTMEGGSRGRKTAI